ncbi:PilZ domain-containing protein [Dyella sp. ASV21]|uniref:PilZ domain-containing protein n=1 Tax=Dyella sp. ASV21 TaxID=2795114 RepID=UPI0018EC1505|nr:PilZ domain-containing protein [Dyella sp. ASV21]
MQSDTWQAFNDHVMYEDALHVACVAQPQPLADLELLALRERNLSVLSTLATFAERRSEPTDEDNPAAIELQRLDSKLNVLMAMLDQLLRRNVELPPRHSVCFNAVGAVLPRVIWPEGSDFAVVHLHIDGCLALPLELPARLLQERDKDHVFVAFETMDEVTRDALERLVFRHHRRKVAGRRLAAG